MRKYLIKGASILDANYNYQQKDILVEGSRIAAVAEALTDKEAEIIDLAGHTLMPGLVNAHTHIQCANDYTDEKYQAMAKSGVCLCHDQGFLVNKPLDKMIDWAKRVNGDPSYPTLDYAGRYIAVAGGYGDVIPGGFQVGELVTSEEECRNAVDYLADSGCCCIKIGMDKGRGSIEDAITLPDSFVTAICQRAKERGLQVGAHVHELCYLARLVAGGIGEAAHVVRQAIPEELLQTMLRSGVKLTATLTNFFRHEDRYSPEDLQNSLDNVRRYWDGGGVVAIATDFMWPFEHFLAPLEEMRLFKKTGLSTRDILICATLNGAKVCRKEQEYGTIEAGKYACLIAVPGALDDDFRKLEQLAFVMNRGQILHNS